MLLEHKVAVIYGGSGPIGGAVARAFAREGATLYLAARTLAPLEVVAQDIRSAGGKAEIAQLDALDAQAVERHLGEIVEQTGRIDISFNAIGTQGQQGLPLTEMTFENFVRPIDIAMRSYFVTSMAVAPYMVAQKSGVILAISANAGRMVFPNVGGFGVSCAAIEGFCRQLAGELGPSGVRVVCLRSSGSPDTPDVKEVMELHAKNAGITYDDFVASMSSGASLKRLPLLAEIANAAALMASDYASAMSAAVANLTCGMIAD